MEIYQHMDRIARYLLVVRQVIIHAKMGNTDAIIRIIEHDIHYAHEFEMVLRFSIRVIDVFEVYERYRERFGVTTDETLRHIIRSYGSPEDMKRMGLPGVHVVEAIQAGDIQRLGTVKSTYRLPIRVLRMSLLNIDCLGNKIKNRTKTLFMQSSKRLT